MESLTTINTPQDSKFKSINTSHNSLVSKVRVVVRVRPFLSQEITAKNGNPVSCVSVLDQQQTTNEEVTVHLKDQFTRSDVRVVTKLNKVSEQLAKPCQALLNKPALGFYLITAYVPEGSRSECYKLDSFFEQEDNNVGKIFDREVKPLIEGLFNGCNATVFAYGATGSGKTFTMQGTDELPGLMPLAMSNILSICSTMGSIVEISYYEVYLEKCYDLLGDERKKIEILDDKDGQSHLRGLSRVQVTSMSQFNEVFSSGIQKRKVAHTGLNDVSSRSHGALVISVTTPHGCGSESSITAKLNLTDLAGNEDNRRTGNEGIRIQESGKINQSLFALSNVIYALNNNKPRVPYRESKLTRILQDSLGGNSRALMVACLNPGEYQESVHTVSLAARSRHVTNLVPSAQKTPKLKVDMEAKLRAWLESRGKTKSAQRIGGLVSPLSYRDPTSSVKKASEYRNSMKREAKDALSIKRANSVQRGNLFDNRESSDLDSKNPGEVPENKNEEMKAAPDTFTFELGAHLEVDKTTDKDENEITKTPVASFEPTPVIESKSKTQSPLRKALSPINSNYIQKASEATALTDQPSAAFFEPKTPSTCAKSCTNKHQNICTPLDKLNECSSNLKTCFIKQYINFLNVASREELLELKGIGPKRADYIVELRESSPLKSLNDLEKIGLSSKQVHHMFGSAAKVVFD